MEKPEKTAPWEVLRGPPSEGTRAWFWLVPASEDETKMKSLSRHCAYGTWSNRLVATHWIPPTAVQNTHAPHSR
jgi:hypothetical protein